MEMDHYPGSDISATKIATNWASNQMKRSTDPMIAQSICIVDDRYQEEVYYQSHVIGQDETNTWDFHTLIIVIIIITTSV